MNGVFIIGFFDFTKQIPIRKTLVGHPKVGVIFGFNAILPTPNGMLPYTILDVRL
jgi:hypothetical protein